MWIDIFIWRVSEAQRDYSLPKLLNIARAFEEKETIEDNYTVDNFSDVEDEKQALVSKNLA